MYTGNMFCVIFILSLREPWEIEIEPRFLTTDNKPFKMGVWLPRKNQINKLLPKKTDVNESIVYGKCHASSK